MATSHINCSLTRPRVSVATVVVVVVASLPSSPVAISQTHFNFGKQMRIGTVERFRKLVTSEQSNQQPFRGAFKRN